MNYFTQVSGAVSIDIRGAKGPNAVTINGMHNYGNIPTPVNYNFIIYPIRPSGIYDPTDEVCNSWPVYQKRGDSNKWLEFFNQSNKWYIKATNDKGRARGWMR